MYWQYRRGRKFKLAQNIISKYLYGQSIYFILFYGLLKQITREIVIQVMQYLTIWILKLDNFQLELHMDMEFIIKIKHK